MRKPNKTYQNDKYGEEPSGDEEIGGFDRSRNDKWGFERGGSKPSFGAAWVIIQSLIITFSISWWICLSMIVWRARSIFWISFLVFDVSLSILVHIWWSNIYMNIMKGWSWLTCRWNKSGAKGGNSGKGRANSKKIARMSMLLRNSWAIEVESMRCKVHVDIKKRWHNILRRDIWEAFSKWIRVDELL